LQARRGRERTSARATELRVAVPREGTVNATGTFDLEGGTHVTATITAASVQDLGLEVGASAHAIVKRRT